ncbi:MAG: ABC transporter permease [Firmicutes bacterium]|nr:ABC transporter permease [Bacillota bacterium]
MAKKAKPGKSGFAEVWRRYKKSKLALLGLGMLCVILFFTVFADLIVDYEEMAINQNTSIRLQPPSAAHWFGTDEYGRDIFARIIYGARNSFLLAFTATAAALAISVVIGSIAAYYGGLLDNVIMRMLDMFMGIPLLLLAIAISASLGPGMKNLIIAVTIAQVPGFTRVTRSAILNIVGMEYIEAAKSYGTTDAGIIAFHILPNAFGLIIVQATMSLASTILTIASLSYIGLGMQPPAPELGAMLSDGKEFMRYYPSLVIFPGLTIALSALSLNLVGDGLRDALDPRLRN